MENKKEKENLPNIPDTLVSYVTGAPLATIRSYKYKKRPDKVGVMATKREIKRALTAMRAKNINELDNQ